jgi:diacylglycerol kinase family enzyme
MQIEDWNAVLGDARYDVAALWGILKGRASGVSIIVDGQRVTSEASTFFINHTQHLGRGLRGCPHALWDDGLLDVMSLEVRESRATQVRSAH